MVIAVQTSTDGGTMHSVKAAEGYRREVLCPRPAEPGADTMRTYEGIIQLIRSGRARAFDAADYPALLDGLAALRDRLLATVVPSGVIAGSGLWGAATAADRPERTPGGA